MLFSRPVTEIIKTRKSWRSYDGRELDEDLRAKIEDFTAGLGRPPFGGQIFFRLIKAKPPGKNTVPGTYGMIRGASDFLVGSVGRSARAMEDFGYLFEKVILHATDLGLGTCWMGGTFSRTSYAEQAGVVEGQIVPAISPVGYCAEKRNVVDSLTRVLAGSKKRRAWAELFFNLDFDAPLAEKDAGEYAAALEMVRLGPSASNNQPWRVVKDERGFHFYLKRSPGYQKLFGGMDLQKIDLGIAMSHFELTAEESGLDGGWSEVEDYPGPLPERTSYIVSWMS